MISFTKYHNKVLCRSPTFSKLFSGFLKRPSETLHKISQWSVEPNCNIFKALFWLFEEPFWDSYCQQHLLWKREPGKICQNNSIVHNKSCLQKNSSTNAIHIMSVLQNTFSVSQNIFGLVNKLCEIGLPMEVNYIVFVFVFVKKKSTLYMYLYLVNNLRNLVANGGEPL